MFDQADLFAPGARQGDPATSKAAARAQTPKKRRASHARVLAMFRLYGDMHDKQLQNVLDDATRQTGLKPMSPSGVRSRRSELSKPNMKRLDEIARGLLEADYVGLTSGTFGDLDENWQAWAREQLRREGFHSELWDTGRREVVDGHTMIVWGLAK